MNNRICESSFMLPVLLTMKKNNKYFIIQEQNYFGILLGQQIYLSTMYRNNFEYARLVAIPKSLSFYELHQNNKLPIY
jgi:hypothetical protein